MKKKFFFLKSFGWGCCALLLCGLFQGCTATPGSSPVVFSGFLEDYSGLRPTSDNRGAWLYEKSGLNLKTYTKVMIDPLVIWPNQDSSYQGFNTMNMWRLARTFHDRMHRALGNEYSIVQEPGPGVLRLRAALTHVTLTRPGLRAPGPLLPLAGDVVLLGSENASGLNARSGEAAIEAELLDSQSLERLAAYIEKRKSGKILLMKDSSSIEPIMDIFDFWAQKFRHRLDRDRGMREHQSTIQ